MPVILDHGQLKDGLTRLQFVIRSATEDQLSSKDKLRRIRAAAKQYTRTLGIEERLTEMDAGLQRFSTVGLNRGLNDIALEFCKGLGKY